MTKPAESETLLEIAAEQRDPVKWAAMMLTKPMPDITTVGEAMDIIEATIRKAIERSESTAVAVAVAAERERCAKVCDRLGNSFGGITMMRLHQAATEIYKGETDK